jgi:type I restriction enzyme S subunit
MTSDLYPKVKFRSLLVEPVRNGIYKQKEFHGRGCKIINMGELFAHPRLYNIPMKRVEISENEAAKSLVRVDDLIFARRSLVASGAGKCSIIKKIDEPTTFESSIIRARPDPHLASSDYLYYYFSSPIGRARMETILRQVAVSGITGSDLMDLEIDCPPPDVQKNIAGVLSLFDDRIALLRESNATLEAIAQALFKSWFVDFDPVRAKQDGRVPEGMDEATAALFPDSFDESEIGPVPRGWATGTLANLADLNPESWTSKIRPETVQYVDLANAKDNEINEVTSFAFDDAPSRARRVLRVGDTAVGTVRPGNRSFAYIYHATSSLTGSTGFAVLRPRNENSKEFLFIAATRDASIEHLAHVADGGAYPAVRPEVVSNLKTVLPHRDVLDAFHALAGPIFLLVGENKSRVKTLNTVRDILLPRLISGQLRLTEATDVMKHAA